MTNRASGGSKLFHLVQFLMPPVMHHSTATWKHPRNMMGNRFRFDRPEIWEYVARLCEQACYDAVFLADVEGLYADWGGNHHGAVQYGSQSICFEPSIVASWMAAATRQVGEVITLATSSYPPYVTTRKFATLDHLSYGRIGWNMVTALSIHAKGCHILSGRNTMILPLLSCPTRVVVR